MPTAPTAVGQGQEYPRAGTKKVPDTERLRGAALLALDQRAAQRLELRLVLLQEFQRRPHDLARGAVATFRDLPVDEPDEVLVKGNWRCSSASRTSSPEDSTGARMLVAAGSA
jgi:hypothetical protein